MKLIAFLILSLFWTSLSYSQISEHENSTTQSNEEITLTLYVKGADFSQHIADLESLIQSFGGKKIVSSAHNPGSPIIKINLWQGHQSDLEEILIKRNINAYWIREVDGAYRMVNIKTHEEVEMKQGEIDKISAEL
jgi:hypothetical protein